ncbi:MAG: hypothetical protein A3F17_03670 [Gammaproteobacteria bacterium RIFCSPHIGHO2_12_FULL_41_15]|nr:MAG: hypothetical protein A3F17_03670 [Gammaproteobacteria bacterium RIFCSPHIGHO2_12_FULL_41_15]
MTTLRTKTWMTDNQSILKDIPLCQVALLGTHDSATAAISSRSSFGPDAASKAGKWRFLPFSHIISARWGRTQPMVVYDQLKAGIRYLDLRTCYLRDFEFFTAHTLVSRNLLVVIEQIVRFQQENPEELIILDFNHFYNMREKEHLQLINFIQREFGDKLALETLTPEVTCGALWKTTYRVIVLYKYRPISRNYLWLWGNKYIRSSWPRAKHYQFLRTFLLKDLAHRNPKKFHVCQCITTPSVWLVTRGILTLGLYPNSLKRTEIKLNHHILEWLRDLTEKQKQLLNIVMIDWATHEVCANFLVELLAINQRKK